MQECFPQSPTLGDEISGSIYKQQLENHLTPTDPQIALM